MNFSQKTFHSNCFLEAIKAKMKYGKDIHLLFISSKYNDGFRFIAHWMWYDKLDGNIYDFHADKRLKHIWNIIWWKGYIRIIPLEHFNRWYKSVGGKEYAPKI